MQLNIKVHIHKPDFLHSADEAPSCILKHLFPLDDCRYAGVLFGITNTFSTLPGIIAPYVVSALTPNVSIAMPQPAKDLYGFPDYTFF